MILTKNNHAYEKVSRKTWVLRKIVEKMILAILNPIVLNLIDSIALVDKVVQRNLVER